MNIKHFLYGYRFTDENYAVFSEDLTYDCRWGDDNTESETKHLIEKTKGDEI